MDIANVRIEFDSGCIANFTASRVSTERVRKLRFFEPHKYVSIDYARRDLLEISIDQNPSESSDERVAALLRALPPHIAAMVPRQIAEDLVAGKVDQPTIQRYASMAGLDPALILPFVQAAPDGAALSFSKPEVPPGEPLRLEIESFLHSVRTRQCPRVTAQQGRNALALALEIQQQMEAHAHRAGLTDLFTRAG